MAVTKADTAHYAKMAKAVDKDTHIASKANNGDAIQAGAMPRGMTAGRNEGKADRNMAPKPTIKGGKYGR
jgi:hypothetical protein